MSGRPVLVIGGAGFIGRALTKRLLAEGWQVHVLARRAAPNPIEGAIYHVGSMAEREFVLPLLRTCSMVVHAASGTTPGSSSRTPTAEARFNIAPTLRLLEFARECPPERVIFLSSGGTLYADMAGEADESTPPSARSYHGAGKIALEAFFRAFAWDTGCDLVTLRPSNVYGPGQEMRRGFGFVRAALECALRGEILEIWGDGSAVRDFLYIDDLADAASAVLQAPRISAVFNVANGTSHCLSDVVEIVRRVSGRPLEVVCRPGRKIDMRAVRLDVTRIAGLLAWRPRVGLEEGLTRTWAWLRGKN